MQVILSVWGVFGDDQAAALFDVAFRPDEAEIVEHVNVALHSAEAGR